MKASVLVLGILCLLLSGCVSAPIDKSKSESMPSLTSHEHQNVAKNATLNGGSYIDKKMNWILISTNGL